MVVDTSAIVAILLLEPEKPAFNRAIGEATRVLMSAVNFVECATVIATRLGPGGEAGFDTFISDARIQIVAVDRETAMLARRAYHMFGKGNHPAKLNLADVFAYALSKATGEPLLFKGGDFAKTDITSAL